MMPKWVQYGFFYLAYLFGAAYVVACFQHSFESGLLSGFLCTNILLVVANYLDLNS